MQQHNDLVELQLWIFVFTTGVFAFFIKTLLNYTIYLYLYTCTRVEVEFTIVKLHVLALENHDKM